jgi:flagellar FliL protein
MSQEKEAAPLPGKNGAPKKGGGLKKLIIIIVLVLLAAGGGGAAYWKFFMHKPAEDAAAAGAGKDAHGKAKEPEGEPGLVPFEPFLVNLADEGGQAYLRATLSLLVPSEEVAKELEAKPVLRTQIRSAVLEVLSTQSASHVSTPEGKTELKKAIKERIESLGLEVEVRDVLFSDFVVQY